MAPVKILVTGATGYIGGSILSKLLEPATGIFPINSISVLIRGENKAHTFRKLGANPILFNSLDESDVLRKAASEHDIVIHTASGFHTASAKALISGLGDRKSFTGSKVHYIHTTGTSNLGDQPITGRYHESHIFSDKEDIFTYEKKREALQIYAQRTTDIAAIETGLALGVSTTLIMSPTIYGVGTGLFNQLSIQVPNLIRSAVGAGQSEVLGDGKGIWDYVHIADLVDLYVLLLKRVLAAEKIPSGENGILFSSSGRYVWQDLAQGIADALFQLGAVKTREVKQIDIAEAAGKWSSRVELRAELGFASNSRTDSDVGRELGWKPVKTEQDFRNHFLEEARIILRAN